MKWIDKSIAKNEKGEEANKEVEKKVIGKRSKVK